MSELPKTITITLRSKPQSQCDGPEDKRLAQLLKIALRRFGFKCVGISESKEVNSDG